MSLLRLERNAAVVGVRIAQVIKKEMSLPLSIFKYWTDSTLTLQYITDKSYRFKVYIANRVAGILEYTDTGNWRHIDGKMNPADICTRGLMDPANLLQRDKHRKSLLLGPDFLTEEHQVNNKVIGEINEDNPEIKEKDILVAASFNKQPCLEYKRFSSYQRIIRVICWMKRFCWKVRNADKRKSFLTVQEIEEAGTLLFKWIQHEEFGADILALTRNHPLSKKSKLLSLTPFLDER